MSFSFRFRLLDIKILRFTVHTMMTHPQNQSLQIKFTLKRKFIKIIGLRVKSTTFRLVLRQLLQSEQKVS
jgi:hypothetical protein